MFDHIYLHIFNALLLMLNITITIVGLALYYQGYRHSTEGRAILRAIMIFQGAYIWLMASLLAIEVEAVTGGQHNDFRAMIASFAYIVVTIGCSYFLYATVKRNPMPSR